MTQFVLVHGSFHGGWAWTQITRRLEARGHAVAAPDLPGSGADPTPHDQVTGRSYVDRICAVVDACNEPVVLVAHSMAGVVGSLVAEARADRLVRLVYLCAFMLPSGQTLGGFLDENAGLIEEELVLKNISVSPDGRVAHFDAGRRRTSSTIAVPSPMRAGRRRGFAPSHSPSTARSWS